MIKVRKIIVVVLAILILAVPVCAAENASEIIIDFNAGITKESDGTLVVDFNISTLGSSTRLGASKVIVEVKENGRWTPAQTYTLMTNPEMQGQGRSFYRSSVTYDNPVSGSQYRAYVKFYATNGTVADTREEYTTSIVA